MRIHTHSLIKISIWKTYAKIMQIPGHDNISLGSGGGSGSGKIVIHVYKNLHNGRLYVYTYI